MAAQDRPEHWQLDPERSDLTFRSPTFWGLATVKGTFGHLSGSGEAAGPNLVSGRLDIDAASVHTGIRKRDDHLRSADFFDVERHPTVAVNVTSAEPTDGDRVDLTAELTVKGEVHTIELPVQVTTLDDGALSLATSTTLNRRTLGVDGNLLGMMGDTTRVEATAVFVKRP